MFYNVILICFPVAFQFYFMHNVNILAPDNSNWSACVVCD